MTARRNPLGRAMRAAAAGCQGDSVRTFARQAIAAELVASLAPTDAATGAAMEKHVDCLFGLAASPANTSAGVAVKLATLLRVRLGDSPESFDQMQHTEFFLAASALADLVLIGDAPMGAIGGDPTRADAQGEPT